MSVFPSVRLYSYSVFFNFLFANLCTYLAISLNEQFCFSGSTVVTVLYVVFLVYSIYAVLQSWLNRLIDCCVYGVSR